MAASCPVESKAFPLSSQMLFGLAVGVILALPGICLPVLSFVCERFLFVHNVTEPVATGWVTGMPLWLFPLIAVVLMAGLLWVQRWRSRAGVLWCNALTAGAIALVGGFAVLSVSLPMITLIQSYT